MVLRIVASSCTPSFVLSATLLFAAAPLIHPKYRPSLKMSLSENLHAAPAVHEYVFALTRAERVCVCVCLYLQEGQQHGERGDQSVPREQEDLSGRGGTSDR